MPNPAVSLTDLHNLIEAFTSAGANLSACIDGTEMEQGEIMYADRDDQERVTSFILPPQHDLGRQIEIVAIECHHSHQVTATCRDGIPYDFTFFAGGQQLTLASAMDRI